MFLVELFLPLRDNDGVAFPRATYESVERTLTEHFGGITVYARAPAKGLWNVNGEGEGAMRDDLVIYEVMTENIDRAWWHDFRESLERIFRQEHVLLRGMTIDLL